MTAGFREVMRDVRTGRCSSVSIPWKEFHRGCQHSKQGSYGAHRRTPRPTHMIVGQRCSSMAQLCRPAHGTRPSRASHDFLILGYASCRLQRALTAVVFTTKSAELYGAFEWFERLRRDFGPSRSLSPSLNSGMHWGYA